MYRHRQVGKFALALDAVILGIGALVAARSRHPAAVLMLVVVLLLMLVFTTATTEVSDGELRFAFGLGFWRRRVPLAEIASAELVPSAWWEGMGIRITTRGMLYNVASGPAVEVATTQGRRFRFGTDDPAGLIAAIGDGRRPRAT